MGKVTHKDIYKNQALKYDKFATKSFSWKYIEKPSLDRYLNKYLNSNSKILDAGCGSGRVIKYLISKGVKQRNIVGIDASTELLKIANNDFQNVKFINSNIVNSQFKSNSFDIIISTMVMHYLNNKGLEKSLKSFYTWSKNNGIIFILVTHPVRLAANDLSQYFVRGWKLEKTPWGTMNPNYRRTASDYINAVIKAGFNIISIAEPEISGTTNKKSLDFKKYSSWPSRLVIVAKRIKAKY